MKNFLKTSLIALLISFLSIGIYHYFIHQNEELSFQEEDYISEESSPITTDSLSTESDDTWAEPTPIPNLEQWVGDYSLNIEQDEGDGKYLAIAKIIVTPHQDGNFNYYYADLSQKALSDTILVYGEYTPTPSENIIKFEPVVITGKDNSGVDYEFYILKDNDKYFIKTDFLYSPRKDGRIPIKKIK